MAAENQTRSDLQVDVHEGASWSRRLSVTVPRDRVSRIRRSVASQIARNVRLPGFRKGHLPENLIEKQFGKAIEQETLDRVIQETYREALESRDLHPINQGQVENVQYDAGSDLRYEVAFEIQPRVELQRVHGFAVVRPPAQIGEADVDAVLARIRHDRSTVRPVEEGKPEPSDEVTVEITDLDEEPAEGEEEPEARTFRFALGEGQAIPDIEAAILTLEVGGEGEFDVRYPDDFGDPEMAGKEQHLRIRLTELRRRELPELDDELAKGVGDFETLDALRTRIRQDLAAEGERRGEEQVRAELVREIVEANPFDVPVSMVERYLDFMLGMDPERAEEQRRHQTPEQAERFSQMRAVFRPQAEAALKRMLVVESLADREGLRATADEVDERVEKLAEQHGVSPGDAWLQLEKSGQLQSLENEITEEKVFAFLKSRNSVA